MENNPANIENPVSNSYYVVAQSRLLEDCRLTDELVVTFLHLSNFLKRDGYAVCSDDWLAQKRHCKNRRIQYHLDALEKTGYIWRETWKEGMYWKRRIWLAEAYAKYLLKEGKEDEKFKKCLRDANSCVIEKQNLALSKSKKLRHNKKSTKQIKKTVTDSVSVRENPPVSVKGTPCETRKKSIRGETHSFSKNDYWRYCVRHRKSWSQAEIDAAWNVLIEYDGPITCWQKFLDGIIEKRRKKCASLPNNGQKKSMPFKASILEEGTKAHRSPNQESSQLKSRNPLVDFAKTLRYEKIKSSS